MSVLTLEIALEHRERLRREHKRLVFTNGHFDLLHVGHLDYLEKAAALGDALFIGVNGDASTRRLKGIGRPLVPAAERARLLAALRPVSGVIIFEDETDTAIALVAALKPDIYVKGGDYAVSVAVGGGAANPADTSMTKPLPERLAVESYGGRVVLIDYLPDHSTSALISRVRALPE